jgi:hypothetical protein
VVSIPSVNVSPSVQASLLLASPDIPVTVYVVSLMLLAYHLILVFLTVLAPLRLLVSPAVSCAAVGPAVDVFLSQLSVPRISCYG